MSDVSDDDASNLSETSRVCRAHRLYRTTQHMDKRTALHHNRPPADQSGKRVASSTATSPDTADILVSFSRECRVCRRGCYEDARKKLLPWNLSFIANTTSMHVLSALVCERPCGNFYQRVV